MSELLLNPEERRILEEVLERTSHDLELEILHTDHHEFKLLLRARRQVLGAILERLSGPSAG